jgi:uncharacterized protein
MNTMNVLVEKNRTNMTRLLIVIFFCIALFDSSCNLKQKREKAIPEGSLWDCGEYAGAISNVDFALDSLGCTIDNEQIFSTPQIAELDSIIQKFEKETPNQIAIVTIDSSIATKEKFDSLIFTIDSLRDDNNSRGFPYETVIVISKSLKKVRISNCHLSTKLPADETKKIIDKFMLPKFDQGNYFDGTKNGLMALVQKIPLPLPIVFTRDIH